MDLKTIVLSVALTLPAIVHAERVSPGENASDSEFLID